VPDHHEEQCWEEVEEECVHEQDCSEPEMSYHSSSGGSRHKRSVSDHEEEAEDEELDTMLRSALDGISASEFLEMTSELSDEDLTEDAEEEVTTGVAVVDANSRAKRSLTHLKKALKGLKIGKKVGKKAAKVVKKKKKSDSSSSSKTCSTIKKCWDKPVRKCKSNPIETCEDIPVENCHDVPQQKCWNEPETKCTSVPEEKCWTVENQVCWEEPREHCTEKKMKVAKKWCLEEDDDKKKKKYF